MERPDIEGVLKNYSDWTNAYHVAQYADHLESRLHAEQESVNELSLALQEKEREVERLRGVLEEIRDAESDGITDTLYWCKHRAGIALEE